MRAQQESGLPLTRSAIEFEVKGVGGSVDVEGDRPSAKLRTPPLPSPLIPQASVAALKKRESKDKDKDTHVAGTCRVRLDKHCQGRAWGWSWGWRGW